MHYCKRQMYAWREIEDDMIVFLLQLLYLNSVAVH